MPPEDRSRPTPPQLGTPSRSNVPAVSGESSPSALAVPAKRRRTLDERIRTVHASASVKEGEHLEDLVLYRNATPIPQSLTRMDGKQVTLIAKGVYTDKSVREFDRNPDATLEKFHGGTVILTRQLGIPFVAAGILEEIEVVDRADPDDFAD